MSRDDFEKETQLSMLSTQANELERENASLKRLIVRLSSSISWVIGEYEMIGRTTKGTIRGLKEALSGNYEEK